MSEAARPGWGLVDDLIQEILDAERRPTSQEVHAIRSHVSVAPFNQHSVRVTRNLRGVAFQGHRLGNRENSLLLHPAKRVLIDRQWSDGTTADQYLEDLREVVAQLESRLLVYRRDRSSIVAIYGPNRMPVHRRGARSLPSMYVVYSVDYRCLLTGYQISTINEADIPGDTLWLD